MNRTYELMFIVRPDMPEEDQEKLVCDPGSCGYIVGRKREEHGEVGQAPSGCMVRAVFMTACTC